MIAHNLNKILTEIKGINSFGEKICIIGATKQQPVEKINAAISAGLTDIGENKAQEFRDKFDKLLPVNYHFFGRLQKNKIKYLIGKASLIQSVDSFEIAKEISRQSLCANVNTNILLEVNLGEVQKGGFDIQSIFDAFAEIKTYGNIIIKGLMCMLPKISDLKTCEKLCLQMREKYDILKGADNSITALSMGMSSDYRLCVKCGSNMIRLGTALFGSRNQ